MSVGSTAGIACALADVRDYWFSPGSIPRLTQYNTTGNDLGCDFNPGMDLTGVNYLAVNGFYHRKT